MDGTLTPETVRHESRRPKITQSRLASSEDVLLEGTDAGKAAGNDPIPITWRNLAGLTRGLLIKYHFIMSGPRAVTHLAKSKGQTTATINPRPATEHAAHSVSHRSKLFTRLPTLTAERSARQPGH